MMHGDEMSGEKDTGVTHGSTNLFADLGLPDAAERQAKTRLAMQVNELLQARQLTQVEATGVLGVAQPEVSALANYRLDAFSVEKLAEFLTLLNLAPGHVPAQEGAAARWDENHVRGREAILDELVADAQENDMGYKR
jgi:predicted XRE-type DNA-binding protein